MKKIMLTLVWLFAMLTAFGQANDIIVGKWKTVDDETGQDKSIVEVFKKSDGKYYGKILELLQKPENDKCVKCKDALKDKPLIGLEIINGLTKKDSEYSGGTITDPKSGKTYKCTITRAGDKLNVRGYVGFSLIGRTQTWRAVK